MVRAEAQSEWSSLTLRSLSSAPQRAAQSQTQLESFRQVYISTEMDDAESPAVAAHSGRESDAPVTSLAAPLFLMVMTSLEKGPHLTVTLQGIARVTSRTGEATVRRRVSIYPATVKRTCENTVTFRAVPAKRCAGRPHCRHGMLSSVAGAAADRKTAPRLRPGQPTRSLTPRVNTLTPPRRAICPPAGATSGPAAAAGPSDRAGPASV